MANAALRPGAPEPAPDLCVLIVEDNATDAMIAEAAVAKAASGPFTVLRTERVARGLEYIASARVDLVLLDLNLPDSKGMDTLRRVRDATRSPIIVVTSEDAPGMDEVALREGAFEILHKGRVGMDAIARLLRLAAQQRHNQTRLEAAERGAARRASGRRYASRMRVLGQPQFRSAAKAREYLESVRWPSGPVCTHCGATHGHTWLDAIGGREGYWTCAACASGFRVTSGTLFDGSGIALHVWLQAVYLLCSYEGRMSTRQLQRALGVTSRTAWFIAGHIRRALAYGGG